MGESKRKWVVKWIILPATISIVLLIANSYLAGMFDDWIRYVVVFLIAWGLYLASAMYRGSKLSKQTVGLNAITAGIFTFSLVGIVTGLITGDRQMIEGWDLHLDVLGAYLLVFAILYGMAVAFTKAAIKS